jgi:hypothetical protein
MGEVVDEFNGVLLAAFGIDLDSPDAFRVIDGIIPKPFDPLPTRLLKIEALHIDLDMVPKHLFFLATGLHRPLIGDPREPVETVAEQHSSSPTLEDSDPMVSLQKPGYPKGSQVVGLAKTKNLFLDVSGGPES